MTRKGQTLWPENIGEGWSDDPGLSGAGPGMSPLPPLRFYLSSILAKFSGIGALCFIEISQVLGPYLEISAILDSRPLYVWMSRMV